MSRLRLACTALGRRIMAGYPTKDGQRLKEPRHDVTSDALKAVVDKIGIGNEATISDDTGAVLCVIRILPSPTLTEGK